jgi:hypothetical protein
MARILFEYLLPLLLPAALYALWLAWQRKRAATAGGRVPAWQEGPWFWLALGGAGLTLAGFVLTALFWGYEPGSVYQPAKLERGQVKPGEFKD